MKRWLPLVLVVLFTQSAAAQWLASTPAKYDRGRARGKAAAHSYSMPQEPANWLFPNVNISQSPTQWAQTEPSIAIDPRSPENVLIGYMDDSIFASLAFAYTNSTSTLRKGYLPVFSLWADVEGAGATDPSVAFNSEGTAYYLFGRQVPVDGNGQNDVDLYMSTDSCRTWRWVSCPVADTLHHGFADSLADKYYLTIDTSSSSTHRDELRATWIEYKGSDYFVAFAASSDKGASWSHVKYLSRSGFYTSPIPAVTANGTIVVTFEQYWDTNAVWVTRSTDGGNSFSTPTIVAYYKNLGPVVKNDSTGHQTIGPSSNYIGINSFPSIAFAKSGRGFITWSAMGDDAQPHVFLSTSDDNGSTWSSARIVDADSTTQAYCRYFPWVATDPVSGNVSIEYYCVPSGPDNMHADQYLIHSTDSGKTFTARKITSVPSVLTVTETYRNAGNDKLWFYGDYINLAGYDETWHPVWTDSRTGGDNEIYTASVQPYAPMPVTDACARDTVISGKHSQIIRWSYTPESTFGYGLPKSYYYIVDKGGATDTIRNGRNFDIDTTTDTTKNYVVTVVGGRYKSIPVAAARCDQSFVRNDVSETITVMFARQPALNGRVQTVTISTVQPCSLSFTLYDELGRELEAIIDNTVTSEHRLRFTPQQHGAAYYIVRGMTASGSWQRTGGFLTLPGE